VKEEEIERGNLANLGREDKFEESHLVTHEKFAFNVWSRCF